MLLQVVQIARIPLGRTAPGQFGIGALESAVLLVVEAGETLDATLKLA